MWHDSGSFLTSEARPLVFLFYRGLSFWVIRSPLARTLNSWFWILVKWSCELLVAVGSRVMVVVVVVGVGEPRLPWAGIIPGGSLSELHFRYRR